MAIFTKLLLISMVPNSFLGFCSRVTNVSEFFVCFFFIFATSDGVNEKKATSEADTKPDMIIKINSNIIPIIKSADARFSDKKSMPFSGSGSLSKTKKLC